MTGTRKLTMVAVGLSSWAGLYGCGGAPLTTRMVDEPSGEAVTYGAPKDTRYNVELDAAKDAARITVYRSSQCDVLPVTVMQRYEEKVRGNQVVERNPVTKRQVVGNAEQTVPCDQSYARQVAVLLEVPDGGRFALGETDAYGQVSADLAQVFQVSSYDEVPENVKVVLRPAQAQPLVEAGTLNLSQLAAHQKRVTELLAKLAELLGKDTAATGPEEITRAYELYAQLTDIASGDPRVQALSARFWELLYARKLDEARERMGKNLEALSQAKDTLKVMGDAAIPLYVQAAVNSGQLDQRALEWTSLRLIQALRSSPTVCAAGFAWTNLPTYGWPADARIAAQYVHFAHGSSHAAAIQAACRAF